MTRSPSLRMPGVALLALCMTLVTATVAFAFAPSTGFSATTYASGYAAAGPAGVAFIGTTMYTADPTDGGLYATASSGTLVRVGTISDTPTGLAAFGGSLYAIQSATNSVVQVNPASGAVAATLGVAAEFGGLQINGLAADPTNGDLYVSAAQGFIYVIRTASLSRPSFLLYLTGLPATFGLTVAADRSIYVAVEGGGVSGIRQITTPSLAQNPIGPVYNGARGVGVVPGYVFVNNADGSIIKVAIPNVTTGDPVTALTGGNAGGPATIGPDGCFYASQGPAVVRLANFGNTGGPCSLGAAGPPPPPPTLTLTNTSLNQPLIGNGLQTFAAAFSNVPAPAGIQVTFTVTRGTTITTYPATTQANGVASFGYTATTQGTDIVTASAVVGGPIVSNALSVIWPRALDTVRPTITYQIVSGDHGTGSTYACPTPGLGQLGVKEYCGWFTSPPTVRFTVTRGPGGTTDPIYSCPDQTLTVNSPWDGTPFTCQATNADGLPAAFTVVLQSLVTPPTIVTAAATPNGPYATGSWTKDNVTVSFACASDPNFRTDPTAVAAGFTGISFCSSPQVVSAEGSTTVSGYVLDVAGTRVNVSTVVNIDKTPPVVTIATAKTADGATYVFGTPTSQNVTLTFTCTDTLDPSPTCPGPVTATSGPSVTVNASDRAGNSQSFTFSGITIDRTGPVATAAVTPAPDANGNNALTATVTIAATDPSGIRSIAYSTTGAQTLSGTVLTTGNPGSFSVPVALNVVGTTTVSYTATDSLGNQTTGTVTVRILATQPTTLTITSAPALAQGATIVSARLLASGTAPVAGQTVTFTTGTAIATGVTNSIGVATATLNIAPGTYSLTATFAGTTAYLPSAASQQTLTVFGATGFVIWGGNTGGVILGQRVVFWGENWWDQVNLAESSKVKDFKGWASTVNGNAWTTKTGNSKPPETVSTYISVIITTEIDRGTGEINGNVVGHAILRVDSPYKDEPSKPVYGVVVAFLP